LKEIKKKDDEVKGFLGASDGIAELAEKTESDDYIKKNFSMAQ